MTTGDRATNGDRTAAVMHSTAAQLEETEAMLHRSAEAAPNETTSERLHALGDRVTAEAKAIDARAECLADNDTSVG
jgi:hypothetical protein